MDNYAVWWLYTPFPSQKTASIPSRLHVNAAEVRRLIAAGESETVEFRRRAAPPAALLRVVAAMANTKGGHLVIGVDEGGQVVGVDADALDPRNISRLVAQTHARTDPPVDVTAEPVRVDGRSVLVLHVPYGGQRPHTLAGSGEVLIRRAAATETARSEDVQRLAIEASLGAFEDAPVPGATLEDLDLGAFRDFLARRAPSGAASTDTTRATGAAGADSGTLLRNLGFVSALGPIPSVPPAKSFPGNTGNADGTGAAPAPSAEQRPPLVPTVAALLLFGRAPQRFLPQAHVELVRFAGAAPPMERAGAAGQGSAAADRATVEGTLPEQLERALDFIRRHMRVGMRVEGFGRHDVPEYPPVAVREVLVNALVHRDYSLRGAAVEVRMYFDRWEVTSPGRLPGPLLPAALTEGEPQRLARNPRLAEAVRVLGLGEGLGLGLRHARAVLQQAGYPPPEIEEGAFSVTVTLSGAFAAHGRQAWLQRARNTLTHRGGNRRQLRAVEHLAAHPDLDALTNADYRRLTRVSEMTALRDLSDLVERGILVRRGEKRGAYYEPAGGASAAARAARGGPAAESPEDPN